jgi:hypothetical protein
MAKQNPRKPDTDTPAGSPDPKPTTPAPAKARTKGRSSSKKKAAAGTPSKVVKTTKTKRARDNRRGTSKRTVTRRVEVDDSHAASQEAGRESGDDVISDRIAPIRIIHDRSWLWPVVIMVVLVAALTLVGIVIYRYENSSVKKTSTAVAATQPAVQGHVSDVPSSPATQPSRETPASQLTVIPTTTTVTFENSHFSLVTVNRTVRWPLVSAPVTLTVEAPPAATQPASEEDAQEEEGGVSEVGKVPPPQDETPSSEQGSEGEVLYSLYRIERLPSGFGRYSGRVGVIARHDAVSQKEFVYDEATGAVSYFEMKLESPPHHYPNARSLIPYSHETADRQVYVRVVGLRDPIRVATRNIVRGVDYRGKEFIYILEPTDDPRLTIATPIFKPWFIERSDTR